MYILTQHTSDKAPRAYRIADDQDIWVELALGQKIAMSPAEAQQLIAELQRELAAVEAQFDAHPGIEHESVHVIGRCIPLAAAIRAEQEVKGWLYVAREHGVTRRALAELAA